MSQPFPGLTEADFDAYQPARATSNVFVRPRLETKQKLLDVGRLLTERARVAGVSLEIQASDERPSVWNRKSVTEQWVFLWRDREERAELERVGGSERAVAASLLDPTPFHRHAFLALYLDSARFEVCLKIHKDAWADVRNLHGRLESDVGRHALTELLHALGAEFTLGVTGGDALAAREGDAARLRALLAAAVAAPAWLYIACPLPRPDAVAQGAALGPWIERAFDALLPLYRVMAWRRDDDLTSVAEELAKNRVAREAQSAESAAREAEWNARQTAEIVARRERAVTDARERVAAMEPARPAAVQAAVASIPSPPPREREVSRPHAAVERPAERRHDGRDRASGDARTSRPNEPPGRTDGAVRTNAPRPVRGGEAAPPPAAHGPRPDARPASRDVRTSAKAPGPAPTPPASGAPAPPTRDPQAPRGPAEWVDSAAPVIAGARVRIQQGPFAGRVGTVVEIDARGQAKISLGLLNARVESRDLVTIAEKS